MPFSFTAALCLFFSFGAGAQAPVITVHPQSFSTCINEPGQPLEVAATGAGGLSFLWQRKTGTNPWENIEGATGSTYVPPSGAAGSFFYRARVTSGGKSAFSNAATVTIYRPPAFRLSFPQEAVCLHANLAVSSGIDTNVWDIVWEKSDDGTNWSETGITGPRITHPTDVPGVAHYRLKAHPKGVPNPVCDPVSEAVLVTVSDCMALAAAKTASATEVSAGEPLSYTITVTNKGPSSLGPGDVIGVEEQLPEGFAVESIEAPGSFNLEAGTWTGLSLAAGGTASLTINGRVSADYTGEPLLNRVAFSPPDGIKSVNSADSAASVSTNIRRQADLEISQTASVSEIKAGQWITYTVNITNNGPSRILSSEVFRIQDELPADFHPRNYLVGEDEGDYNYLTGSWTGVDFTVGKTIRLTISGQIDPGVTAAEIAHTVSVLPPSGIDDPTLPNTSRLTTPIAAQANIELAKNGPDRIAPNEDISYSITVSNKGPSDAPEVAISDPVPPGIEVSSWQASATGGAGILQGESGTSKPVEVKADMPAGSEVRIIIRGRVSEAASGEITNTATATILSPVLDPTPAEGSLKSTVEKEDELVLRKAGPSRANPGDLISYTVQLINNTSSAITGINFNDLAEPAGSFEKANWQATGDPGVSILSGSEPAAGSVSGSGFPVEFTADIPPNKKIILRLKGTTRPDFLGDIVNRATATAPEHLAEAHTTTHVRQPSGITISKTGQETADAGEEVSYTISVSGTGPATAENIVIRDRLPLGSRYISSKGAGEYDPITHTFTWEQTDIGAGQTVNHQLTLAAPAEGNEIINTAVAGNKSDAVTTSVRPVADMEVNLSAPDTVYQEDAFTYLIQALNKGPSTARDIVLTSRLPAGLRIGDADGGEIREGEGGVREISWTLPELQRNERHTYRVEVQAPAAADVLENTVTTQSVNPDPEAANNSAVLRTVVLPAADLAVEKTGPAEAYAGEVVEYQLRISNLGPSAATNISVSDRLPGGAQFVSSDTDPESSDGPVVSWLLANLPAGEDRVITVRVKAPDRVGEARNTAEVSAGVRDKDDTNNRSIFSTLVTPAADMEMIKTGPAALDSAGVLTYELLIRNQGPSTALDVAISDQLPEGTNAPVSISNGGVYDPASHSITWPAFPAMAAGTERLYTVRVAVSAEGAIRDLTNVAQAVSGVFDPLTENNRSELLTTVYPPPEVYFSLAPARICKGAAATALSGGGVSNGIPGTGEYSGPGVNGGLFDPDLLEPGSYTIRYTFTTPGGAQVSLTDIIHLLPAPLADAGPDLEILEGDSVTLQARAQGERVQWSPRTGMDDPSRAQPVVAPGETTTYRLVAENPGTCSATDEVTVFVYPRLEIPNAFTPNDDGVNDTWEILKIEEYPDATVQVFNRHGDRIYYSRGYGEEWDGKFRNQPVPPGTYYYVIHPNGGILKPVSGPVTIVR